MQTFFNELNVAGNESNLSFGNETDDPVDDNVTRSINGGNILILKIHIE